MAKGLSEELFVRFTIAKMMNQVRGSAKPVVSKAGVAVTL